ncbi:MAG: DUF922 domain-containing protein [Pseudomonadota bacterium]
MTVFSRLQFAVLGVSVMLGGPVSAVAEGAADGIVREDRVVSYGFETSALGKAGKALDRAAPIATTGKPKVGDVESNWDLRLKPVATAGDCAVGEVTITVTNTILTPEWTNIAQQTDDAQREWARYLGALKIHQDGHIAITMEMVSEIRSALLALPPEATCSALQVRLGAAAAAVEDAYKDAHVDYDKATRSGKKQGAVLRKQFNRPG